MDELMGELISVDIIDELILVEIIEAFTPLAWPLVTLIGIVLLYRRLTNDVN